MKTKKNIEQNFFIKFVNLLSRTGSKTKAKRIVTTTFTKLKKRFSCPLQLLLIRAWKRLDVFVEARKVRIRRNFFVVPFTVTVQRRILLALKWIVNAALLNKKKLPLSIKLYNEIVIIQKGQKSEALKLKAVNNASAQSNRSNMHYRW